MEIKLGCYKLTNQIIGVLDNNNEFINYLDNLRFNNQAIYIDGNKITNYDKRKFLNNIKIVEKRIDKSYLNLTIEQYMRHYVMSNFLNLNNYDKKIEEALTMVGLKKINFQKKLIDLSKCETKLVQLATILLSNPNVIILDSYIEIFDTRLKKKIITLLNQLVEKYKKSIVLITNNSDIIYKYTNYIFIVKNNKILIEGNSNKVFSNNVQELIDKGIEIPEIVMFSYKANLLKNIKLNYHKDIRDLIKDIYKKV